MLYTFNLAHENGVVSFQTKKIVAGSTALKQNYHNLKGIKTFFATVRVPISNSAFKAIRTRDCIMKKEKSVRISRTCVRGDN